MHDRTISPTSLRRADPVPAPSLMPADLSIVAQRTRSQRVKADIAYTSQQFVIGKLRRGALPRTAAATQELPRRREHREHRDSTIEDAGPDPDATCPPNRKQRRAIDSAKHRDDRLGIDVGGAIALGTALRAGRTRKATSPEGRSRERASGYRARPQRATPCVGQRTEASSSTISPICRPGPTSPASVAAQ